MHGPQEPYRRPDQTGTDAGFLTCHVLTAPYSGPERKKRKLGDRRAVEMENILKQTFESIILLNLYQRSEISIVVNVFEADGSLPCAIINATTLALMEAGIAMKDMVIACSVGIYKQNIYLDVNQLELTIGSAYIPLAIESSTEEVIYLQLDNRLSVEMLEESIQKAITGCRQVRKILVTMMRDHMKGVSFCQSSHNNSNSSSGGGTTLSQYSAGATATVGDMNSTDMNL